jgi:hypothetical protein
LDGLGSIDPEKDFEYKVPGKGFFKNPVIKESLEYLNRIIVFNGDLSKNNKNLLIINWKGKMMERRRKKARYYPFTVSRKRFLFPEFPAFDNQRVTESNILFNYGIRKKIPVSL